MHQLSDARVATDEDLPVLRCFQETHRYLSARERRRRIGEGAGTVPRREGKSSIPAEPTDALRPH